MAVSGDEAKARFLEHVDRDTPHTQIGVVNVFMCVHLHGEETKVGWSDAAGQLGAGIDVDLFPVGGDTDASREERQCVAAVTACEIEYADIL